MTAGSNGAKRTLQVVPPGVVASVALAVGRRPGLWPVAARQLWGMRAPAWWRRAPFLPVPPADYAAFRIQTMYGGAGVMPDGARPHAAADIVGWLAWARSERTRR